MKQIVNEIYEHEFTGEFKIKEMDGRKKSSMDGINEMRQKYRQWL